MTEEFEQTAIRISSHPRRQEFREILRDPIFALGRAVVGTLRIGNARTGRAGADHMGHRFATLSRTGVSTSAGAFLK